VLAGLAVDMNIASPPLHLTANDRVHYLFAIEYRAIYAVA
jgi:hypothetical protein